MKSVGERTIFEVAHGGFTICLAWVRFRGQGVAVVRTRLALSCFLCLDSSLLFLALVTDPVHPSLPHGPS